MKTKIIPFDKEMAEKIQAGEIKGKIKTCHGRDVRVICWDRRNENNRPIVALIDNGESEAEYVFSEKGEWDFFTSTQYDLVLKVPDNESQFKPFDRVLVRNVDQLKWACSIFSHLNKDQGGTVYYNAGGLNWNQCIPYEGNEDLVGTTNMPKED